MDGLVGATSGMRRRAPWAVQLAPAAGRWGAIGISALSWVAGQNAAAFDLHYAGLDGINRHKPDLQRIFNLLLAATPRPTRAIGAVRCVMDATILRGLGAAMLRILSTSARLPAYGPWSRPASVSFRQVTPVRFANALAYGAVLTLTPDKKATMIKKLISLALASVSTLALAGCGATDNPVMDQSLMGDGMGNKTGLGGYWWAYGDRTDTSSVVPDTGKTNPLDTSERPPKLKPSIGVNNGIDAGAYHVKGYVGVAPLYSRTDVYDTYWDNFYGPNGTDAPGVCGAPTDVKASACKEMKYPSVGMGFGFKASNVPLGDDAKDMVGVTFKMKLGPSHAATCVDPTSTTGAAMACPVEVSLPMDLTDVPDPSYGDQFGTLYANYAPTGKPTKAGVNTPICTFPGTVITNPDGSLGEQGSTTKTCFANLSTFGQFTADGKGVLAPVDATKFTTFCLSWSVFGPPSWAISGLNAAKPVSVTKMADLKDHITKMQFEAFKPLETATAPVDFDFFVDDVYLLDQAKWDEICVKGGATIPVLL